MCKANTWLPRADFEIKSPQSLAAANNARCLRSRARLPVRHHKPSSNRHRIFESRFLNLPRTIFFRTKLFAKFVMSRYPTCRGSYGKHVCGKSYEAKRTPTTSQNTRLTTPESDRMGCQEPDPPEAIILRKWKFQIFHNL